jgi:nicotinamidase-related amidase
MHPHLIDASRAFLLVIDVQEAYRKALHEWDRTVARTRVLLEGAGRIGVPVLYTEQYRKGLGSTAPELLEVLKDASRFEKRTLSALGAPGLPEHVLSLDRRQAVVCGIETHACINQTVHDLIAWGFTVHLPVDALSSRRPFEHEQALQKMLRAGGLQTSVEQVLLECVRSADHPAFRSIQVLLR